MNSYSNLKIEWCGEVLAQIGYGVQARSILKPLIEGGADIKLIPAEDYLPESRKINDPFWISNIESSKAKPDCPIRVNFSIVPQFKPRMGAINVGYMLWETTRLPNEWVAGLNQMDYLIVPSESHEQVYRDSGVKTPIKVFTPTFTIPEVDGEKMIINEIPEGTVKFLFSSNWVPRKNHADLVAAFCFAFNGQKDVALIIKSWPMNDDANSKRNIEGGLRHFSDRLKGIDRPRVYLLADYVSHEKMESIIRATDVYVSASKAEGYDSATLTAMCMEKIVIGIPSGIRKDYLKSNNSLPIDFSYEPIIDSAAPGYDSYQLWARPSIESLIDSMRTAYRLVKNPRETINMLQGFTGSDLGKNARAKIISSLSPEVNTEKFYKIISEIENECKEKYSTRIST